VSADRGRAGKAGHRSFAITHDLVGQTILRYRWSTRLGPGFGLRRQQTSYLLRLRPPLHFAANPARRRNSAREEARAAASSQRSRRRAICPDLLATILHQLGLDHEKLTYRHAGNDESLTDAKVSQAQVVEELLCA